MYAHGHRIRKRIINDFIHDFHKTQDRYIIIPKSKYGDLF